MYRLWNENYCYRQVKYHPFSTCASGTSVIYQPVLLLRPFLLHEKKEKYDLSSFFLLVFFFTLKDFNWNDCPVSLLGVQQALPSIKSFNKYWQQWKWNFRCMKNLQNFTIHLQIFLPLHKASQNWSLEREQGCSTFGEWRPNQKIHKACNCAHSPMSQGITSPCYSRRGMDYSRRTEECLWVEEWRGMPNAVHI